MKKILVFGFVALLPFLLAGCNKERGAGEVIYDEYYLLEGQVLDIEAEIERIRHFFEHVRNNDIAEVIEELEAGFNAEIAHAEEGTALLIASAYGYKEMVLLLIHAYGVDINARTESGLTALMLAAEQGHLDIVEILIWAGAYVDDVSDDGKNALMMAVENGELEVVRLLARWTLHLEALDIDGRTAEMLAELHGFMDIRSVIIAELMRRS